MNTFQVQAQLAGNFHDFYVKARNVDEAIRKARAAARGTAFAHRFTNFVV